MSSPNPLASPTLSTTSDTSSFIMLSDHIRSSAAAQSDDSDDEIIYNIPPDSFLSTDSESYDSDDMISEDDFVVLSRPRSQARLSDTGLSTPKDDQDSQADSPDVVGLTTGLQNLTIAHSESERHKVSNKTANVVAVADSKKKAKKARTYPANVASAYPSPGPSPAGPKRVVSATAPVVVKKQVGAKSSVPKKSKNVKPAGLGGRSIVDDASDRFSDYSESDVGSPSMYEEAFGFITSFLSNPAARKDSACRLALLQALIIELGLATSSLPSSLTAAKAYLKSRAFLNIKEYIAVRDQGPAAVQRIMHPSRSALIKHIRKTKNKASLGWVKDSGLNVLLVHCYN